MKDEKELILYPNKSGTVKTLIEEATKQVEFSDDGTRRLRMVSIQACKISLGPREEQPLECKRVRCSLFIRMFPAVLNVFRFHYSSAAR